MKKKIQKVAKTSVDPLSDKLSELNKIIPEAFAENKIDWKKLKMTLGEDIDTGIEKYGLTWAGKSEAFKAIRAPATGTFAPQEKESKNWDKTENIFIEGDNLEVLKLLQKKYRGQIKMCYLDPPYNTGKDFIYKDNFTENTSDYYERTGQSENGVKLTGNLESNGRYHSDWLTMMYPRLFLAHKLLKDDGIIFVSIDDNEVANLRMIMNEIFGEENFITNFIWEKTQHFGRQKINSYSNADYVLCYAKKLKTEDMSLIKELLVEEINSDLEDAPLYNASNPESTLIFPKGSIKFNIKDGNYISTNSGEYKLLEKMIVKNGYNENELKLKFRSRWSQKMIDEECGKGTTFWIKSEKFAIRTIYREDKNANSSPKQIIFTNKNNSLCAFNRFGEKVGTNEEGSSEIKKILEGSSLFDYPKPVSFINYLISLLFNYNKNKHDDDFIVLDFFAGSGTTAHAVMDLNAEDGGNRKFILVQIPEKTDEKSEAKKAGYENIAQISQERIRRAGAKIEEEVGEKRGYYNGLREEMGYKEREIKEMQADEEGKRYDFDDGFKSFKLSQSNYRQWQVMNEENTEKELLEQAKLFAEKPLMDNYDAKAVVYEILTKEGFDLNADVKEKIVEKIKVWVVSDTEKKMFISFAKKLTKGKVEKLELKKTDIFVCLDSALDDTTKINLLRNFNLKVV